MQAWLSGHASITSTIRKGSLILTDASPHPGDQSLRWNKVLVMSGYAQHLSTLRGARAAATKNRPLADGRRPRSAL